MSNLKNEKNATKDILSAICKSSEIVSEWISDEDTNGSIDFEVRVLSDGTLDHNTLYAPKKEVLGLIRWSVDLRHSGMIPAIPSWERFNGIKVSIGDVFIRPKSGGRLKRDTDILKTLRHPSELLGYDDYKKDLDLLSRFFDYHNIMIAALIKYKAV